MFNKNSSFNMYSCNGLSFGANGICHTVGSVGKGHEKHGLDFVKHALLASLHRSSQIDARVQGLLVLGYF